MPFQLKIVDRFRVYVPVSENGIGLFRTDTVLFGGIKVTISDTAFVMEFDHEPVLAFKLFGQNLYLLLDQTNKDTEDLVYPWVKLYKEIQRSPIEYDRMRATVAILSLQKDIMGLMRKHVFPILTIVQEDAFVSEEQTSPGTQVTLW